MKCVFHPDYRVDLPSGHPYPMGKYPLLRQLLLEEGLIGEQDFLEPEVLRREALARVHTAEYLDQLETSTLSAADIRRLGIPWSDTLWRRSRLTSAGTLLAAREALKGGLAANLAGGTHHAFPDHGEGFCVLNDAAIAIRALQSESRIARATIIDLDVHQGNGTAAIFRDDPTVFTLSLHGAKNFPFRKEASDLDVELPDGCGDAPYLAALDAALAQLWARHGTALPGLAFYLAGADPHENDRLGRLKLTAEGLAERDRRVLAACRERRIPVALAMAGGYGRDIGVTVEIQRRTLLEALASWKQWNNRRP